MASRCTTPAWSQPIDIFAYSLFQCYFLIAYFIALMIDFYHVITLFKIVVGSPFGGDAIYFSPLR